MSSEVIFRTSKLCKSFGPTRAVVDVDLELRRGEVHGLIGENGSGKSTVSSLISGMRPPDSGTMEFKGKPYAPHSTLDGSKAGISMIVQEMGTISGITVAENIFLGDELNFATGGFISSRKMNKAAKEALLAIGVEHIDPSEKIDKYNFEDRKLVELARSMLTTPEILIVDETTTALAIHGRKILFDVMNKLTAAGSAILFISHDLEELAEVCDILTVMRDGEVVTQITKDQMDPDFIKEKMVGRVIEGHYYRADFTCSYKDEVVLEAKDIFLGRDIRDVSLQLHKGEILGIGGLSGSGMHELGKVLYGAVTPDIGTVSYKNLSGKKMTPWFATLRGMGYISKSRDTEGLILMASIRENVALASYKRITRFGFLSKRSETVFVNKQIDDMSIKCVDGEQATRALSGGNKQKVVFAKWLGNETEVFILDCPTRGIDVGVKTYMYHLMEEMKRAGKSIVLISEELPELIGMSDRILIMKDGKISGEFRRSAELSESELIQVLI